MDFASIVHGFCIDVGIIFDVFETFFYVRARTLINLEKKKIAMSLHAVTIHNNMIFGDFHESLRYLFWLWFLISLGIDVGSMLATLCIKIHVWG